MKGSIFLGMFVLLVCLLAVEANGGVIYVNASSATPISPYTNWTTAASTIQDAVDAASDGDEVLVTNGVYQTGGRTVGGEGLPNRVAVTKALVIQSVNGPAVTIIRGNVVVDTSAVRCLYLTNGATLSGFTLTAGGTWPLAAGAAMSEWMAGAARCASPTAVLTNCFITGNAASYRAGGVQGGTLNNCMVVSNSGGFFGGGLDGCTANHCSLIGNVAAVAGGGGSEGGAAINSTLNYCQVISNYCDLQGGGTYSCTLSYCTLIGNSSVLQGGGALYGALTNCTLTANSSAEGGGADSATLVNCALTRNSAIGGGGGAYGSTLLNCTLTGNTAASGGGADASTLNNCVIYYNHSPRSFNYSSSDTLNYCCTLPLPFSGTGNIDAEPRLSDGVHLTATSPCRGAGSAAFTQGSDIDGQAWGNPASVGCDEFYAGPITGPLGVSIQASGTNVATGFVVEFTALIDGAATSSRWEFDDGTSLTNRPLTSRNWTSPGDYPVVLRAFNDTYPAGISATVTVHVATQPVLYVALSSTNPTPPYSTWNTAATNIQDAIDTVSLPGSLVLVSNGIYQTGTRVTTSATPNRVAISRPALVRSLNGPAVTVIQGTPTNGDSAVRCAYLTNGAVLSGFTLTAGATITGGDADRDQSGGSVWCESSSSVVSNCVIVGNSANIAAGGVSGGTIYDCLISTNSAGGQGAGADSCVLVNCTLAGNYGPDWWGGGGGGAHLCTLSNCTLSANSGYYGGGANSSHLYGCTLTGNSTPVNGGAASTCTLDNCTLSQNSAWSGGGADSSTLNQCWISGNTADSAGGVSASTLRTCVISGNVARFSSGGASGSSLSNCTLTGNAASSSSGGAADCTLRNCIIFYNSSPAASNFSGGTLNFCCTLPLPLSGFGNITLDPQLADPAHLSAGSPCRGAGSAAYAAGADIDGQAWNNPPSIGCDEYHAGSATGPLNVAIVAAFTNVTTAIGIDFTAQIAGNASASRWDFGDGTSLSNRPFASHAWSALGNYLVVLRAFNDTYPAGISATVTVHVITQPVHYVALNSAAPIAPFTSWATAATNIQDAVDAVTTAGALVLVSNGVYNVGARPVNNDVPHRLVVNKPITVASVNGPAAASIEGHDWNDPVRCAYVAAGALLSGFTLTNGAALPPWSETNDEDRSGGGVWCANSAAVVSNCIIIGCAVGSSGGGAYSGLLLNCLLTNNSASSGGGAFASVLQNCALQGNSAGAGGGAYSATLSNCTLVANTAGNGGGAWGSILQNCVLTGNAASAGGGVDSCTVDNSALVSNAASDTGGGAHASALYNCTLTGNAATNSGGGASGCTNFNSIVFYNFAASGSNWIDGTAAYSCSLPLPPGPGNLASAPLLADTYHISAGSPCRGAGFPAYATGIDLDGDAWLNPPAIGCDEFRGPVTGNLSVAIQTPYTNVAAGLSSPFAASITGHASASSWSFGDGTVVSNQPYALHSWAVPGDYVVVLRAFNDTYPAGVSAAMTVHVQSPIHYVAQGNLSPVSPFTSWATAATNIQDAVDAAFVGGTVIVSNGVYQFGGKVASGMITNRVTVTQQLSLLSVNGPGVTSIQGNGGGPGTNAVRCVSLVRNSVLAGFTLMGGVTRNDGDGDLDQTGGGVWCDSQSVLVSNCVISFNNAVAGGGGSQRGTLSYCILSTNSGAGAVNGRLDHCSLLGNSGSGAGGCTLSSCLIEGNTSYDAGGVGGCTLTNCVIRGNSASRYGGGSEASTMYNCLVVYNTAGYGGGGLYNDWAYNCTIVGNSAGSYGGGMLIASYLANCILYYNSAPNGPNYWSDYLFNCCSLPAYAGNTGNFSAEPAFVDLAGGDFRLRTNSPCINSGDNAYVANSPDLGNNPRIAGGTVDVGAYEFQPQTPVSLISFAWLQQYNLPTDGSADFADPDGDGMNNWQEWIAGTIPTNAASFLGLQRPSVTASNTIVSWQSVSGKTYFLQRSTNLAAKPSFLTLQSNILGQAGSTIFIDTNVPGPGASFYRVGIQQ